MKILFNFLILSFVSSAMAYDLVLSVGQCERNELVQTTDWMPEYVTYRFYTSSYYKLKLSYTVCKEENGMGYKVKKYKIFDVGFFEDNDYTPVVNQHLRARCEDAREELLALENTNDACDKY